MRNIAVLVGGILISLSYCSSEFYSSSSSRCEVLQANRWAAEQIQSLVGIISVDNHFGGATLVGSMAVIKVSSPFFLFPLH